MEGMSSVEKKVFENPNTEIPKTLREKKKNSRHKTMIVSRSALKSS